MKKLLGMLLLASPLVSNAQCTDLFFSEYIEGTSNNKSLEIYNPTPNPITLTGNYSIKRYTNGGTIATSITLTGTINPNDVFVVSNGSSSPIILASTDLTSGNISHNGNDAYELFNITTGNVIDVIGLVGNDPGTGWTVNGVTAGTLDHTLRRKPNVQSGTTVWTGDGENTWNVYPVNTFTYLGFHVMNTCGSSLISSNSVADFCMNNGFNFTSNPSGGTAPYTYAWEFGDGTVNVVSTQNGSYTFASAGNYNVTFVVTDASNNVYSEVYSINAFPAGPVASFTSAPMDQCEHDTLTVTNTSTGGTAPIAYSWDFDNGNTSNQSNPSAEIYNAGTYTVVLTASDVNGCSSTSSSNFTVNPQDDASISYSDVNYCPSSPNPLPTLTGTSGGTYSCNGCLINSSTGEIDIANSGNGSYTVTYTTSGTCPAVSTFNINISATGADASITPVSPVCELTSPFTLTAATAGGVWSGNGIVDINAGTFDPSAAGVGTHTITYTISGNCGDVATTSITVNANQEVMILSADTVICNDIFGIFLSAQSGGTWSGTFVNDNSNGNGFFSSAAIAPGDYYAVYTISGLCGDVDSMLISVAAAPTSGFNYSVNGSTIDFTSTATNAVTYFWSVTEDGTTVNFTNVNPSYTMSNTSDTVYACLTVTNNEGCESIFCEYIYPTGVSENHLELIQVYPNPFNGIITLSGMEQSSSYTVELFDLIGKIVFTQQMNSTKKTSINLSSIPAGTYFIKINDGKKTRTIKLIKMS